MKTKKTMKSIAAAALALTLTAVPAADIISLPDLLNFGIVANAASISTAADFAARLTNATFDAGSNTITLTEDVDLTAGDWIVYEGTDDITINLSTYKITNNSTSKIINMKSGKLIVNAASNSTAVCGPIQVAGGATVDLNGGNFSSASIFGTNSTLNINGATLDSGAVGADVFKGNSNEAGTKINIKSGTVKGRIPVRGDIVIEGGDITGCFYMWGDDANKVGGTVTVKGGTLTSNGNDNGAIFSTFSDIHDKVKEYTVSPKIKVEGGTINGAVCLWDGTDFEMTGGSVTYTGTLSATILTNGSAGQTGSDIVVTGGTVTGGTGSSAVYLPSGSLTVDGDGKLTGDTAVIVRAGTVDIRGGTLTATGASETPSYDPTTNDGAQPTGDAIVILNSNYPGGKPQITVSGGTVKSENGAAVLSTVDGTNITDTTQSVDDFVSGGTFEAAKPLPENVVDPNTGSVTVTKRDGTKIDVLGTADSVNDVLENLTAADVDKVTVNQKVTEVKVPDGVTVDNQTGEDITVNDVVVADGETGTAIDTTDPAKFVETEEVPATCAAKGTKAYYTYDGGTDKYIPNDDGKYEKIADDTALEIAVDDTAHDYTGQTAEYAWSADFSSCTATVKCANDNTHVLTVNGTVTSEITTPATEETEGVRTYTATFTSDKFTDFTNQIKTEATAKLPSTDPQKVAAAKAAVTEALSGLTVSNSTTQADVDAVVQKALEGTGVTGVTTAAVTKATEEAAGKVDITVALSKGEAKDSVTAAPVIDKLSAVVTFTKVEAKAASCTAEGNIEYYKGSDNKLYTLADGKYTETTLAAVTTAKTAHSFKDGVCTVCGEKDPGYTPPAVVTYYSVAFTGDYAGSGVTVTGARTAGSQMTVNVPVGYSVTVVSGGSRITTVSDGTGTFVMPAGNVIVKVESYLGMLTSGYKNAYIYSYDKDMNHIKTNSVRGGMTAPEGEITVKLGSEYAGKSVTLYNGRKNTSAKADEAVLDSRGQATFAVKSGKNYTLVVE